jgi:preprotein translocase subunit SecF
MANITIKNRSKACLMVSGAIILIALLMTVFGYGMNLGIDFSGGIIMRYDMGVEFDSEVVRAALAEQGITESQISATSNPSLEEGNDASSPKTRLEIRLKDIEDPIAVRTALETKLRETYEQTTYVSIDSVGAVAGSDLIRNAILSVLVAWVLMMVYIAIRFDLYSGLAAVMGILHDVLIMVAFMVLLRPWIQVNSTFIAALLTIVGYSINNTIVIFDRIRENIGKNSLSHRSRDEIVSHSVQESLTRTVNTTLTTLLTTVSLYILGVASVKEFTLPLIIGMLSGIYSSNMINGYVWVWLLDQRDKAKLNAKAKKA